MKAKSDQGAVLIITLLFLLVITLLGLSIVESSLLQTKMRMNFSDKILSFQQAENALSIAKHQIHNNADKGQAVNANWSYEFKLTDEKICQNKICYAITAIGKQNRAETILHDIYVVEFIKQADGSQIKKYYSLVWQEL